MIDVALPNLFVVPLFFSLVMLFACSVYYASRRAGPRKTEKKTKIYRCLKCGHVYIEIRDVPLAKCTRCGSMNEAVKR
jgi:hypothetical protein